MRRSMIGGCLIAAMGLGVATAVHVARDRTTGDVAMQRAPDRAPPHAARLDPPDLPAPGAAAASNAARDHARTAGRSSRFLARLPADDQAWVLAESAAALARGQVDLTRLPAYVDQLASVREFDVIERTQPYLNPESFR